MLIRRKCVVNSRFFFITYINLYKTTLLNDSLKFLQRFLELDGRKLEFDVQRYTREYQRIRTKMTEKSSVDNSISSSSVTAVQSLPDSTVTG